MTLKRKLAELEERAEALTDVIPLTDGRKVAFPPDARLEALMWLLSEERVGEPPRLLEILPRLAPGADPRLLEYRGLVWALGGIPEKGAAHEE